MGTLERHTLSIRRGMTMQNFDDTVGCFFVQLVRCFIPCSTRHRNEVRTMVNAQAQIAALDRLRIQKTLIEERKALAMRRDALMDYFEKQEELKERWGYAYHGMRPLTQE